MLMEPKNYAISTKELILKQAKHKGGTETFVYEPSNIEEEPLGNLYIIGWMKKGSASAKASADKQNDLSFVPNLIASLMRREFYKQNGEPAETLFEISLKKANAALWDIAASSANLADVLGLCVINIAGEKIRFAQSSPIKALLYRDNGVIDISHRDKEKGKRDFFASVVAGDIFSGDKIIFGTAGVLDLFSDSGIKKLGSLNQTEQAEIISGLYQKNAREAALPDQAAVLLEIRKQKEKSVIVKPIAAVSEAKKKLVRETRRIEIRFDKKHKIIAGLIALFIILSPLYIASQARRATARQIKLNISKAENISSSDKESARALLARAQASLPVLLSNWYLAEETQKISEEIDKKLSALDGIYKDAPAEWAKFDLGAFKFSPQYISDTQDAIYIFGAQADLAYKINGSAKNAVFIPLLSGEEFAIERILEKDGDIYLINDTEKSAYIFYPENGEIKKVEKTLKKILGEPSKQNSRTSGDSVYYADNPGKIIKETRNQPKPEKFLLGSNITIIDFTLSADAKNIYVLARDKILAVGNR